MNDIHSESALTKKLYKFGKERRHYVRKPLENVLSSFRLNNNLINEEIITLNISRSGIGFKTKYFIDTNSIIEIYLKIPDSISVPIISKLIWKGFLDDTSIYGAEIIALPENMKDFLYNYTDQ